MAIDPADQLYIVDTTGRIQVFDTGGQPLRVWSTPETENGRPTGLSFDGRRNELLVADTHYYRVLVYSPDGEPKLHRQIGGTPGVGPGEFAFVTDAARDDAGHTYVGEYGDSDRIQKFSPDGKFICQWGGTGGRPGEFVRPQSLLVDGEDLWIADACNHRIQRFDLTSDVPQLVDHWGSEGGELGELYYPYGLEIDASGNLLVCEYGNQRVQKFTPKGAPLATWGSPGHQPGQLYQPWSIALDSRGWLHVLDSNNHRIQCTNALV